MSAAGDEDLLSALQAEHVNDAELFQILEEHFGSSGQVSLNEVAYPDAPEYALKVVYKDDKLAAIVAGPALTPADVEALRSRVTTELVESSGPLVDRTILFSALPVTGWWRFRDVFQILPVPASAPRPITLVGEHPFVLESAYRQSSDLMIRALRRARIEMRLALLLNTLLEGSVGSLSQGALYHWVFLPTGAGEELRAAYYQAGYAIPGFRFETDSFSPTSGIPPIDAVDTMEYYGQLGIRPARSLDIPDDLAQSLSRFDALLGNDQTRYLRACFWLKHSERASRDSQSASFLALINAVEALMPGAGPSERCPTCGQSRGKGPTRRFAEFLDHFAPYAGEIEPARARLYGTRSALSHGGLLFHGDMEPLMPGLHPRGTQESEASWYARHIVRIALVNWLSDPGGCAVQTRFKRSRFPRRRRRFSFRGMVPGP